MNVTTDLFVAETNTKTPVSEFSLERGPKVETDRDGRIDPLNVGLFDENLPRLETQLFHLLLRDWLTKEGNGGTRGEGAGETRINYLASRRLPTSRGSRVTHQFLSCSI